MFRTKIGNAPNVPRARAFLDAPAAVRNPLEVFERYRREYGPTFAVHLGGGLPAVVSTAPEVARHVLQRNATNYRMSDIRVKRMAEFQGQGLLNSHGEAWRSKRRFLHRGFTPDRLAELVPMQERVTEDSLLRLDDLLARGPVDIGRFVLWVNFRLFGRSVFGQRIADEEIEQMAGAIHDIQEFILRQIVRPYMIPWYRLSGRSRAFQRVRRDAESIARRFIADRRGHPDEGGDLLGIMLDTPYPEAGRRMSDEQILVETLQLFVAGNETSPTALAWALYLLARRPDLVEAMRAEVREAFGGGAFTLEGLHRLGLTYRVIRETLRLYPSFWVIDRVAIADDLAGPYEIPGGTTVLTYLYGLHRNPAVWPEPERFDPSRFAPEARAGRDPFAYLPFGGGPRKCIGSAMATAQMLLVLAKLVERYDFEPADDEPIELRPMMILRPARPIRLFVRRVR